MLSEYAILQYHNPHCENCKASEVLHFGSCMIDPGEKVPCLCFYICVSIVILSAFQRSV